MSKKISISIIDPLFIIDIRDIFFDLVLMSEKWINYRYRKSSLNQLNNNIYIYEMALKNLESEFIEKKKIASSLHFIDKDFFIEFLKFLSVISIISEAFNF